MMDAESRKKIRLAPHINSTRRPHRGSQAFVREPETIRQIATRMRLVLERAKGLAVLGGVHPASQEVHRREVGWASLVVEGIQAVGTESLAEGLQVQAAAGKACLRGEGAGVH